MCEKYQLSKQNFEYLINHLVNLEDKKGDLLDEYDWYKYQEYKNILEDYLKKLNYIISNTNVSNNSESYPPFAIVGSKVEIQDLDNNEKNFFHIVCPDLLFEGDADDGSKVSFLSPVGKSLLLKRAGDIIEITLPKGKIHYKIKSIQFL